MSARMLPAAIGELGAPEPELGVERVVELVLDLEGRRLHVALPVALVHERARGEQAEQRAAHLAGEIWGDRGRYGEM